MRIAKALAILILPLISHGALSAALTDANPEYVEYVGAEPADNTAQKNQLIEYEDALKDLEYEKAKADKEVKELTSKSVAAYNEHYKLTNTTPKPSQDLINTAKNKYDALDASRKRGLDNQAALAESIEETHVEIKKIEETLITNGAICEPKTNGFFSICRIRKAEVEYFADLGISPTLADGGEVKLGAIRGFIDFGENRKMPISVIIADVTSQTQSEEANAIKLLDPEQGVNFTSEFAGRFSFLGICGGDTTARCMMGFNYGLRYLKLQEDSTEESKSTYGGFVTFKTSAAFNIFKNSDDGYLSTDPKNQMGTIRFYYVASYFYHDGGASDEFFSGIVDNSGNPTQFDREYGSNKYGLAIYINDSINFTYSKYSARASNGLMDEESISVNFDVLKFK